MTVKIHDFEGWSNGATITTGGTGSGDTFSSIIATGGTTATASNTSPGRGSMGGLLTQASGGQGYFVLSLAAAVDTLSTQCDFSFDSNPTAIDYLFAIRSTSASAFVAYMNNSNNKIQFQNVVGGGLVGLTGTSYPVLAANTHYRLDVCITKGTTTTDGRYQIKLTKISDGTVLFTYDNATNNTGTNQFQSVRVGRGTNVAATWNQRFDDIRVSDYAGLLPAPGTNFDPTISMAASQTVSSGATVSITSTDADVDGTIASRLTEITYPATGAPTLTNATSATTTFTAGAAGSLYIVKRTITDNSGGTAVAYQEVRVPSTGQVKTLPGYTPVGSTVVRNTGGAASEGAALSDGLSKTAIVFPAATGVAQKRRYRLAPMTTRTGNVNMTHRLFFDINGSATVKARLFEGTTQRVEWTISGVNKKPTTYTTVIDTTTAGVTDWGNLWVEYEVV